MSLSYDPSKAEGEFKLLPPGEYEVFISAIDHGFAQTSGNEMLTVNYKVRDDVEQEGQGQEIRFDRFVNTEAALFRFHALNKALDVQPGASWNDFKEWKDFIKGKAVKVVVKHGAPRDGKVYPEVKGFKASEVGGQMKIQDPSAAASSIANSNGAIHISDDDLPF